MGGVHRGLWWGSIGLLRLIFLVSPNARQDAKGNGDNHVYTCMYCGDEVSSLSRQSSEARSS